MLNHHQSYNTFFSAKPPSNICSDSKGRALPQSSAEATRGSAKLNGPRVQQVQMFEKMNEFRLHLQSIYQT